MKIKIKKSLFANILVVLLLYLLSMNFFAKHFYIVLITAICLIWMNRGKIPISWSTIALFALSCCLVMADIIQGDSVWVALKDMAFPLSGMIGALSIDRLAKKQIKSEDVLARILFVMALGFCTHVLLNIILNYVQMDITIGRNTRDIWSQAVFSATGQASLFIMPISVGIASFFSDTTVKNKVMASIFCVLALVYNLQLACRTPFVLAVIIAMIAIVCMAKSRDVKTDNKVRIAGFIMFLIICAIILYEFNIWGIRSNIEASNLFIRLLSSGEGVLQDQRLDLKIHYVKEIWKYPFGGSNIMTEYGYAHDLIFDTWDKAGIVAAFCAVAYIIGSVSRLQKILRNKTVGFFCKQLVLCLYCAFYLEFLVEPILYGMPWLFTAFCIIDGAVSRVLCMNAEV